MFVGGMLLSNNVGLSDTEDYDSNKRRRKEEGHLDAAGILDARRFINIYYDEMTDSCKIILVNISSSISSKVDFESVNNKRNGILSFTAIYTFDVMLDDNPKYTLKDRVIEGLWTLTSARRLDRDINHDIGIATNTMPNLFSDKWAGYNISESYDGGRDMVSPEFYTKEHQYAIEKSVDDGSFYEMDNGHSLLFNGRDLIDSKTKLFERGAFSKYYTVVGKIDKGNACPDIVDESNPFGITSAEGTISEFNNVMCLDTLVNGGVFAYDSQKGYNYNGGAIIGKKYLPDQVATNELQDVVDTLRNAASSIEREHGSISMFYTPSVVGSKCRIIFKDYASRGADFNDSGAVVDMDTVDSGSEVDTLIGEYVEFGDYRHSLDEEFINYDDALSKEKFRFY